MPKRAIILGLVVIATMTAGSTAAAPKGTTPANPPTPAEIVADHCAAWSTTDREKRDRLLEHVFASDGVYNDPTPTYVSGRAALSDEISNFQRQYPGARFRCSAPQVHHGAMRVSWLLLRADGKVEAQGMDFYELGSDGLIRRVTGFFGPPPALEAEQ